MSGHRRIARLILANSSMLAVPACNFVVMLLLTRQSVLAADAAYFFMAAWIGLMTMLDGGRSLKVPVGAGRWVTMRVLVATSANLWMFVVPVLVVTWLAIAHTALASRFDTAELLACTTFVVACGYAKVTVDTLRTVALRSPARMAADGLSSGFAAARLFALLVTLNRLPFAATYAVTLLMEVAAYLHITGVPFRALPRVLRPRWRRRLAAHWDYLRVNLAYLVGSSADRIVAYYLVPESVYKGLVLLTSVLNVSAIPHKLVENEVVFPSGGHAVHPRQRLVHWMSLGTAGLGAAAIGGGLHLAAGRIEHFSEWLGVAAGAFWLAATLVYNRAWALSLFEGATHGIARTTLVSGGIALGATVLLSPLYLHLLPIALVMYALVNVTMLCLREASSLRRLMEYLLVAVPGATVGFVVAKWWF